MWNPPNDQSGQISARMETTPSLGSASISISQQQAPKKFAPVVAPKPKFNPFKQIGEGTQSDPAGINTKNTPVKLVCCVIKCWTIRFEVLVAT